LELNQDNIPSLWDGYTLLCTSKSGKKMLLFQGTILNYNCGSSQRDDMLVEKIY
jgi:hypothetical protein